MNEFVFEPVIRGSLHFTKWNSETVLLLWTSGESRVFGICGELETDRGRKGEDGKKCGRVDAKGRDGLEKW